MYALKIEVLFRNRKVETGFVLTISPAVAVVKIKHKRKHIRLRFLGYLWPIDELCG